MTSIYVATDLRYALVDLGPITSTPPDTLYVRLSCGDILPAWLLTPQSYWRWFRTVDEAAIQHDAGRLDTITMSTMSARWDAIDRAAHQHIGDAAIRSARPIEGAWTPKTTRPPARTHLWTPFDNTPTQSPV